jgi:glycerol-3-phosphate dehydrogenase
MAGVDDRTIRKYKGIFRRRGLLFEHPGQTAVWTTDGNQWLSWLENFAALNGPKAAEEIADQYPTTVRPSATDEKIDVELIEEDDL